MIHPLVDRRSFLISALTALGAPVTWAGAAERTDLSGKWLFEVHTTVAHGTARVTFRHDASGLSGHYSSANWGEIPFKGSVNDQQIEFEFQAQTGTTKFPVHYSGRITNSSTIVGDVKIGKNQGGTFTATRQRER